MSDTARRPKRKYIDCRDYPSDRNCTLRISGAEDEVLEIAIQHATGSHGHENTPELREKVRSLLQDEEPAPALPRGTEP